MEIDEKQKIEQLKKLLLVSNVQLNVPVKEKHIDFEYERRKGEGKRQNGIAPEPEKK